MPSYAMLVFLLPQGICREIETLMNEYWWTGTVGNGRGLRWRSWSGLTAPKTAGGMGFRSLHEMNLALLGKQAWILVTNPTSLVAQGTRWDVNRIQNTFENRDAKLILNIPILVRKIRDSWYWYWDAKGAYTVKTCYKRLKGELTNVRPWSRLWNVNVSPKVKHFCGQREPESAFHLFAQCTEVTKLWGLIGVPANGTMYGNVIDWFFALLSSLNGERLERFIVASWGWQSRNNCVWKGIFDADLMATVLGGSVGWSRPEEGRLKLNTDALLNVVAGTMGFGWVLHFYVIIMEGSWRRRTCMLVHGSYTINEAEAICLREALSWLKNTGMGGVDVDMDSQNVFYSIFSHTFNSTFGFIIDDVKELASMIDDVKFCFTKRSANYAAHTVAREATSDAGCGEWFDTPPSFLVNCLLRDLMH
ncbi:PREDICTED: uncharacterized protein LOC109159926 [Ipomoea nil]|uniref:uncharacterized protein LOC109159926 n=1 Tax=Ipomoea nil TaxID=35883 RepID=UPI0009014856|nr:PREDICTED: uncharacterized protein LOC109159926 [Ipomoea nil]